MTSFDAPKHECRRVVGLLAGAMMLTAGTVGCTAPAPWPQWGGPNRNFTVEIEGLADTWPENGPPKVWHRELGDGHSSIVADDGVLYTMYRIGTDEFSVALDAETGKTLWQHKNPSAVSPGTEQYGFGPNATPLVAGNRLYTVGANAFMHCFDKRTGKVLWKRDLAGEYGAPTPQWSYSCSPIAYQNLVIVPVDRTRPEPQEGAGHEEPPSEPTKKDEGQSLMAFDQKTGEVIWKTQDFRINYSSPILVNFDGQDQLVFLMTKAIMGVNPESGELLWHEAFPEGQGNMATPFWTEDNLLFYSNPRHSRLLKLTKQDGHAVPQELWQSRKLRIHHANPVRIGDLILGSSGQDPAMLVCLDFETGKRLWVDRTFGKATCVYGDGKLIILDQDGNLALATVTPEDLTIHSKCKIAERYSWTAPTLVGRTLYVRDRTHIMALDLG